MYGPRQIDARIDQDPVISQQLALWNQQGSRVLRGSLLAIPIEQSLIYVQPLYLSATEQGALPELRRVIVAYGNQIAMEPTLEQSLRRIFGGRAQPEAARPREAGTPLPAAGEGMLRGLVQRAWEAWQRGQEALRRGDWTAYGQEQKRLEEALRQLNPAPSPYAWACVYAASGRSVPTPLTPAAELDHGRFARLMPLERRLCRAIDGPGRSGGASPPVTCGRGGRGPFRGRRTRCSRSRPRASGAAGRPWRRRGPSSAPASSPPR